MAVKRPVRDVDPFDLSRWPTFSRHDSFKFIWGINGAANWYREAAHGTFELYDVEGVEDRRCFAPATLKSFRTMFDENGKIPKCPNRHTGRNITITPDWIKFTSIIWLLAIGWWAMWPCTAKRRSWLRSRFFNFYWMKTPLSGRKNWIFTLRGHAMSNVSFVISLLSNLPVSPKQFLKGCNCSTTPAKESGRPFHKHPPIGPGTGANPIPEAECQFKKSICKICLNICNILFIPF